MRAWLVFIRERFHPAGILPMVLLFLGSHAALGSTRFFSAPVLLGGSFTLVFFFKLRLYDELKDYDTDRLVNPGRPLPRGLLVPRDLHRMIVVCLLFESLLAAASGIVQLPAAWIAIAYSLLMYREFFLGRFLRPLLTTYALTHTVVIVPLSLALSGMLSGIPWWNAPERLLLHALGAWGLFNVFEFGRKTFAAAEEREGVDSYSKTWGHGGAVLLTLSQGALGIVGIGLAVPLAAPGWAFCAAGWAGLALAGIRYLRAGTPDAARLFRTASGLFICWCFAWPILTLFPGGTPCS